MPPQEVESLARQNTENLRARKEAAATLAKAQREF